LSRDQSTALQQREHELALLNARRVETFESITTTQAKSPAKGAHRGGERPEFGLGWTAVLVATMVVATAVLSSSLAAEQTQS